MPTEYPEPLVNYFKKGAKHPNAISPLQTVLDTGFGALGVWGGCGGALISTGYFYFSPALWFTPGVTPAITVPVVDNTRVNY